MRFHAARSQNRVTMYGSYAEWVEGSLRFSASRYLAHWFCHIDSPATGPVGTLSTNLVVLVQLHLSPPLAGTPARRGLFVLSLSPSGNVRRPILLRSAHILRYPRGQESLSGAAVAEAEACVLYWNATHELR